VLTVDVITIQVPLSPLLTSPYTYYNTTNHTFDSILPIRKIRLATVRFRATPPAFREISSTFTAGSVLNALLVVLHSGKVVTARQS
jgi:hypothetical protein